MRVVLFMPDSFFIAHDWMTYYCFNTEKIMVIKSGDEVLKNESLLAEMRKLYDGPRKGGEDAKGS